MNKFRNNTFNRSIFIDSSNLEEIQKWNELGIIDGVTTNQYIFLKDKIPFKEIKRVIRAICKEMKNKPVSVELSNSSSDIKTMVNEARMLNEIATNIVVKVPLIPHTLKSLEVINKLAKLGIAMNITLLMTFEQIVIACLSACQSKHTSFISLFWGRTIEDQVQYRSRADFVARYPKLGMSSSVNNTPNNIVKAAMDFIKEGNFTNLKLIVGSIRTASMVGEALASGSNIVTVTPDILKTMLFSQRTIETLEQFDDAWTEIGGKK